MGGSAAGCAAGSAAGLVPPVPLRALQRGAGTLSRLPGRAGARPHTTRGGEQTHRASAAALRERVLLLEHRLRGADGDGRRLLEGRIRLLRAMGREARELAVLCERYYERGYCRNGKYTL